MATRYWQALSLQAQNIVVLSELLGKAYRIRIDKHRYVVEKPAMTGRELLTLAGKTPVTGYMISQKMRGGEACQIGLEEKADFIRPNQNTSQASRKTVPPSSASTCC
jgi:hypothetical protein